MWKCRDGTHFWVKGQLYAKLGNLGCGGSGRIFLVSPIPPLLRLGEGVLSRGGGRWFALKEVTFGYEAVRNDDDARELNADIRAVLGQAQAGRAWQPNNGARAMEMTDARQRRAVRAINAHVGRRRFEKELKILTAAQAPGVLRLVRSDLHKTSGVGYIVTEAGRCDLAQYIRARGGNFLAHLAHLGMIWNQMLDAVSSLHRMGVVHLDIKLKNFVVVGEGKLKLIDFGISWLVNEAFVPEGGTPGYRAPEVILREYATVGFQTDFWSVGAILHWILLGLPPILNESDLEAVNNYRPPQIPPSLIGSPMFQQLMTVLARALERRPEERYLEQVAQR